MIPHSSTAHDIPHSPPFHGRFDRGDVEKATVIQARLTEIARRNPRAVLGVLKFWLEPDSTADGDARDG